MKKRPLRKTSLNENFKLVSKPRKNANTAYAADYGWHTVEVIPRLPSLQIENLFPLQNFQKYHKFAGTKSHTQVGLLCSDVNVLLRPNLGIVRFYYRTETMEDINYKSYIKFCSKRYHTHKSHLFVLFYLFHLRIFKFLAPYHRYSNYSKTTQHLGTAQVY